MRKDKAVGMIDLKGGLSTYYFDDNMVDIEDEYTIAFVQFFKQKSPLINTIDDATRIKASGKQLYKSLGFDKKIEKLLKESDAMP